MGVVLVPVPIRAASLRDVCHSLLPFRLRMFVVLSGKIDDNRGGRKRRWENKRYVVERARARFAQGRPSVKESV